MGKKILGQEEVPGRCRKALGNVGGQRQRRKLSSFLSEANRTHLSFYLNGVFIILGLSSMERNLDN